MKMALPRETAWMPMTGTITMVKTTCTTEAAMLATAKSVMRLIDENTFWKKVCRPYHGSASASVER